MDIKKSPDFVIQGGSVILDAEPAQGDKRTFEYEWTVKDADGDDRGILTKPNGAQTEWRARGERRRDIPAGAYYIRLAAKDQSTSSKRDEEAEDTINVLPRPLTRRDVDTILTEGPIPISLERSQITDTPDLALWSVIREQATAVSYARYAEAMDALFCRSEGGPITQPSRFPELVGVPPFPDMLSYKALKVATEAFLLGNANVLLAAQSFDHVRFAELRGRAGLDRDDRFLRLWEHYLQPTTIAGGGLDTPANSVATLPYLALIRQKLPEFNLSLDGQLAQDVSLCYEILAEKFTAPLFLELIWSYWHEEGMLVQTLNTIAMRFQNRRGRAQNDPLAALTIDPLRPLNNLLWGYIQDEQHRLTLTRRAYEYDHEYGMTIHGRAVPELRNADPRSRFIEAFHTLLHRAAIFYTQDDDTTMIADPFPVLNALSDVHVLLAEGAHNQYGDLPFTARQEMLMQQWLLARPEFREFLPTRIMVVFAEPWMERVDAMKKLQGWTDTSIRYFHDLAVFGEQLLLSIRFGNWGQVVDREQAGNWARFWREEINWYIHAYQVATGVELGADITDVRMAELAPDRYLEPAYHLQRRLAEQRRRIRPAMRRGRQQRALPPGAPHTQFEQPVSEQEYPAQP